MLPRWTPEEKEPRQAQPDAHRDADGGEPDIQGPWGGLVAAPPGAARSLNGQGGGSQIEPLKAGQRSGEARPGDGDDEAEQEQEACEGQRGEWSPRPNWLSGWGPTKAGQTVRLGGHRGFQPSPPHSGQTTPRPVWSRLM